MCVCVYVFTFLYMCMYCLDPCGGCWSPYGLHLLRGRAKIVRCDAGSRDALRAARRSVLGSWSLGACAKRRRRRWEVSGFWALCSHGTTPIAP